jgi:hypothetical protein
LVRPTNRRCYPRLHSRKPPACRRALAIPSGPRFTRGMNAPAVFPALPPEKKCRPNWFQRNRYVLAALTVVVLLILWRKPPQLLLTEPTVAEVVGRYHLSKVSFGNRVDADILSKAKDAYIELRLDGSAVFHKLPVVPEEPNKNFAVREFRSGSGTYEISALGSTARNNFYGLYLSRDDLPKPISTPRFVRDWKSFGLAFEYFDGDFVRRMTFMRD